MIKKVKKKKVYKDYQELLFERLQDPEIALGYLNQALLDDDQRVFLLALKDVLQARGEDITALAKAIDMSRPSIYRMLSKSGNPRWDSLAPIFNALGYHMQLIPAK
ncbi:hypothetical protein K2W90_02615 [Candidatus Babeliales bacterium]|nr:hypothetical protein [Candidatus Babeliales bacterium]